jgi:hypothetical protein
MPSALLERLETAGESLKDKNLFLKVFEVRLGEMAIPWSESFSRNSPSRGALGKTRMMAEFESAASVGIIQIIYSNQSGRQSV